MNILLNGAAGKMGSEVIKAVEKENNLNIICGFDQKDTQKDFPIYQDIHSIKEKVDVIIDFSIPQATLEILKYAKENKTPIVIATTGFSEEELAIIKEYAKDIPIFLSSNMSLNITLMTSILEEIVKALKDTDIEIIETHHNRKVDSPSGTAIMLANAINKALDGKMKYDFDRMQKREKRSKDEIGFSSVRGGNIVGKHTVTFFGENESLEITHTAYSRGLFAEGAIKAAKFIIDQTPGIYNMQDLLN